jgi:thymidylate synthase (FAD)
MRIVEYSASLLARTLPCWEGYEPDMCSDAARVVERCGRVSWKSEPKMEPGSADGFITRVVNIKKDFSIAEHASATLLLVTDRYSMAQFTRHRHASPTVESTHYINYGKKYGEIEVCAPLRIQRGSVEWNLWKETCERAEDAYLQLLNRGVKHYNARHVLPGCLKTEMALTSNMRGWTEILKQRLTPNNTPETAYLAELMAGVLHGVCPEMLVDWPKWAEGAK